MGVVDVLLAFFIRALSSKMFRDANAAALSFERSASAFKGHINRGWLNESTIETAMSMIRRNDHLHLCMSSHGPGVAGRLHTCYIGQISSSFGETETPRHYSKGILAKIENIEELMSRHWRHTRSYRSPRVYRAPTRGYVEYSFEAILKPSASGWLNFWLNFSLTSRLPSK